MKKLSNLNASLQDFYVVVPARFASTRLPGKPLLDIAGKPMVVWVVERAMRSGAKQAVVATDDVRIVNAVESYGYTAIMTSIDHASGTDRIAEVARKQNWADDAIVVNVQGDEPLIDPALIAEVASTLSHSKLAVMSTACHRIHDKVDFLNPNVVKLVLDAQLNALYFSRAPIPYPRDTFLNAELAKALPVYRHLGIYAYRVAFLKQYALLQPSLIEQVECLEQLRVLHHGHKIAVLVSDNTPATGVDTQADLDYVRSIMG
ncbi:MAG: 3-deoxy-manno-octulosonate cytidylyltransferase [Methylophilaceae bacterium]